MNGYEKGLLLTMPILSRLPDEYRIFIKIFFDKEDFIKTHLRQILESSDASKPIGLEDLRQAIDGRLEQNTIDFLSVTERFTQEENSFLRNYWKTYAPIKHFMILIGVARFTRDVEEEEELTNYLKYLLPIFQKRQAETPQATEIDEVLLSISQGILPLAEQMNGVKFETAVNKYLEDLKRLADQARIIGIDEVIALLNRLIKDKTFYSITKGLRLIKSFLKARK